MKRFFLILGLIASGVVQTQATVSEPDNIVYGTITFGTTPVTAANTNVVVEARPQLNGPPIASYRMGTQLSAGNYYSLRISLESLAPVSNPAAAAANQTVFLVVYDETGVRAQATYTVGLRGQIIRLDLAGALAGQTSHPADNNPADSSVSIGEVVAYSLAWRTGAPWSTAPNNIPLSYAVRAGALWRGGEGYRLDSTVSSAPAWWVNTNTIGANTNLGSNTAVSIIPSGYVPGVPFTVADVITPAGSVNVYGVEDQPPVGWPVANISHGGVWDAVNQKVKWGLFFDQAPRSLTYQVIPPANAIGPAAFAGQASFDGTANLNITGQRAANSIAQTQLALQSLGFGNGFRMSLKGSPGQSIVVESSTDLKNWQTLSNVVLDNSGAQNYVDPLSTNRQRFYRIRPGP